VLESTKEKETAMVDKSNKSVERGEVREIRRTDSRGSPLAWRRRKISVPIGIEKVLCRAALDRGFKETLLTDRERALEGSGYSLTGTELQILKSVPTGTLKGMIEGIDPPQHGRRKFMRAVAASVLLAATAATPIACDKDDDSVQDDSGIVETDYDIIQPGTLADLWEDETAEPVDGLVLEDILADQQGDGAAADSALVECDVMMAVTGIMPDVE